MSKFSVTPDQLEQSAARLAQVQAQVESQLQAARSQVQGVQSAWQGAAQGEFTALMGRWDGAAKQLNETLGTIHHNLKVAAGNYREAESAAAKGFKA